MFSFIMRDLRSVGLYVIHHLLAVVLWELMNSWWPLPSPCALTMTSESLLTTAILAFCNAARTTLSQVYPSVCRKKDLQTVLLPRLQITVFEWRDCFCVSVTRFLGTCLTLLTIKSLRRSKLKFPYKSWIASFRRCELLGTLALTPACWKQSMFFSICVISFLFCTASFSCK